MFKKNGGFTLVELIVVIAIMAVLVGVAVPTYGSYFQKAENIKATYNQEVSVRESSMDALLDEVLGTTKAPEAPKG